MYSCRLRTSFRLFVVVSPSFCLSLTLHAAHTTQDFICNWVGNQKWVRDMQWPGKEAFNAAPVLPWTPKGGDAPAGTFQATGNLTCVPSLRHPPVLSAPSSRHQLPSLPRHFSPGAETAPREGGLFYFFRLRRRLRRRAIPQVRARVRCWTYGAHGPGTKPAPVC